MLAKSGFFSRDVCTCPFWMALLSLHSLSLSISFSLSLSLSNRASWRAKSLGVGASFGVAVPDSRDCPEVFLVRTDDGLMEPRKRGSC